MMLSTKTVFAAPIGQIEYEDWLTEGDENFEWHLPQDEWDAISLNYTSKEP